MEWKILEFGRGALLPKILPSPRKYQVLLIYYLYLAIITTVFRHSIMQCVFTVVR